MPIKWPSIPAFGSVPVRFKKAKTADGRDVRYAPKLGLAYVEPQTHNVEIASHNLEVERKRFLKKGSK